MNGADKGGRANSNRRTITTDMPDKINRFSNQKNLTSSIGMKEGSMGSRIAYFSRQSLS
eukprot:m.144864 g.144864  ORF g.144864 m.144864 type:complete len:59 (+) comp38407_c3_seq30:2134-2310(+)